MREAAKKARLWESAPFLKESTQVQMDSFFETVLSKFGLLLRLGYKIMSKIGAENLPATNGQGKVST